MARKKYTIRPLVWSQSGPGCWSANGAVGSYDARMLGTGGFEVTYRKDGHLCDALATGVGFATVKAVSRKHHESVLVPLLQEDVPCRNRQ